MDQSDSEIDVLKRDHIQNIIKSLWTRQTIGFMNANIELRNSTLHSAHLQRALENQTVHFNISLFYFNMTTSWTPVSMTTILDHGLIRDHIFCDLSSSGKMFFSRSVLSSVLQAFTKSYICHPSTAFVHDPELRICTGFMIST